MGNPDRYDYDPDNYTYDEDYDVITSRDDPNEQYDGEGNSISPYYGSE